MTDTAAIDRRIITRLVRDVLATGRTITVSLEGGYDAEDGALLASTDSAAIVAEAMSGDEAHLFIHEPGEAPIEDGQINCLGWVFVVLGNEGWDVVCDYTTNLEGLGLLVGVDELASRYSGT